MIDRYRIVNIKSRYELVFYVLCAVVRNKNRFIRPTMILAYIQARIATNILDDRRSYFTSNLRLKY